MEEQPQTITLEDVQKMDNKTLSELREAIRLEIKSLEAARRSVNFSDLSNGGGLALMGDIISRIAAFKHHEMLVTDILKTRGLE